MKMRNSIAALVLFVMLVGAGKLPSGTLPDTTPSGKWPTSWNSSHAGATLNRSGLSLAWQAAFTDDGAGGCNDAVTGNPAIGQQPEVTPNPNYKMYAANGAGFTTFVTGGVVFRNNSAAYDCVGNKLNVHLVKVSGAWQGADFVSTDKNGVGEYARFGLFEETVTLPIPPTGIIPWPSTWYEGYWTPYPKWSFTEIDAMEFGRNSTSLTDQLVNIFNWPIGKQSPPTGQLQAERGYSAHPQAALFDGNPHIYSMLATPSKIVVYWDGVEQVRFPVQGMDQVLPWEHEFSLSMFYDPGSVTSSYTASVTKFSRWECTPAPTCLDRLNP